MDTEMKFIPIKTRTIMPPRDNIYPILDEFLPRLRERDVLFIASKVLAIHQGRCVPMKPNLRKEQLVKREAERYARSHLQAWKNLFLTIKEHTLIANAGIDESNANGHYILWPRRSSALAKEIRAYLQKKFGLKKLAVIVTDSHVIPFRHGVLGVSIGFYGMEPLFDYSGTPDIFGRLFKYSAKNVVDALATMAVLIMGEGRERTPFVVLRGAKFIEFTNKDTHRKSVVAPRNDLYAPLWRALK
jgi:dihydrofolate synthase / folylpolyglutamate synthase